MRKPRQGGIFWKIFVAGLEMDRLRKMSLLTELEIIFSSGFYKDFAPDGAWMERDSAARDRFKVRTLEARRFQFRW